MAKFATTTKPVVQSAVRTVGQAPDTVTHEGGTGYTRDAKSELYLLAIANMASEATFYENGKVRDARFEGLVAAVTREDPDWVRRFVPFLRDTMNMRSASVITAAEYVKAGAPNGRAVIDSACRRADEPAEILGYWFGRHGRALPKPVKRGIADAARRLYTERTVLKYDGDKGIRMGDVIELTHPNPATPEQSALFEYLIARRHNRDRLDVSALPIIAAHLELDALPSDERTLDRLAEGVTWEWASAWYGRQLDAAFWEALIPRMGLFALVRNLRNFDDAGIGQEAVAAVRAKIGNAEDVAGARMFPLRFYAAHREVATTRWSEALDAGIELSLANIPALTGRTLVLVDVSGSMFAAMAGRSRLQRVEAAAIFAAALAMRAEAADLVTFGTDSAPIAFRKSGSVLRLAGEIAGVNRGGTQTWQAVRRHLLPEHRRVVIITDEQASYGGSADLVGDRPLYTFNLAGYAAGHAPSGPNRHTFGGLSDAGFVALSLLERGRDAGWPF